MRIPHAHRETDVLNITPLIDVVFNLLLFFMLTTNFAGFRLIRVETPRETEVVATSEGAIVIGVDKDRNVTFDSRPVEQNLLETRVREVVAIDPGRTFLVRPGPGLPLQEAIFVYDTVRRGGAQAVSFSSPRAEGEGR